METKTLTTPVARAMPLKRISRMYATQLLRRLGLVEARQLLLELREEVLSGRHEVRQGACAC